MTGVVTVLTGACATRDVAPHGAAAPPVLSWIGSFTRPALSVYPSLTGVDRFGSISGLAPDAVNGQWVAAIDDREDSRVAWLSIDYSGDRLDVTPVRMVRLRAGAGIADRLVTQADLEGIASLADGTFVLSEEGHEQDGEPWQPALLRMTREGLVTQVIAFPPAYRVGDPNSGVRPNQGFESVARMPDGRLIAGLEQPLIQDGDITFDRGGPGRLVEFVPSGDTFRPRREWTYPLSPTPRFPGFTRVCADGENGLVDLVALSNTRLVALERACLLADGAPVAVAMNPVRLYLVDITRNPATKSLLLDLTTLENRPPELARLENFEALAFGPIVNNMRTLLVASDDNFRRTQKTAFLLFGMR